MFEYLQQIDNRIYDRYLTLEKNIKAASNSFYDAYLDLQEQFLKAIVEKNSIVVAPHESCGTLLKHSEVKELFLDKYGLDSYTYDKMGDYAKKANEHKHRKEKVIEADTIVNYMHVFYDVSSRCALAKGLVVPQYNGKYFKDIYGSMENVYSSIAEISERLGRIEEEQQKYFEANIHEHERQGGQAVKNRPQNDVQFLKNFIARSEKKYDWFGTKEQFKKDKTILICIQVALIVVGLLSTIISSICFKLYSTFTLFENIVLIQTIILLTYTLRSKKLYNDYDLAKYTSDIFVLDGDGIWRDSNKEKKRYKWLRRISYVAVIANIICIWTMGSGAIRIFATIFELAFLGLTIVSLFVRINLYCMYSTLFISGLNTSGTERVTLVHDNIKNKLCTLEEYQKRYSDFA